MTMTNNDEYEKLTREQLIELLKMYGRFALTLDGLWFIGMERIQGLDTTVTQDEEVWRYFGKSEGKMLKKFLHLDRVDNPADICRIYLLTSVFGNMGGRARIEGQKCFLAVTDCHPQKARIKKNLGEFPCKSVGTAYFEGLLTEINPDIQFRCAVCPPDEHPKDLWCEWEVWILKKVS